jgi:hypothetical protein
MQPKYYKQQQPRRFSSARKEMVSFMVAACKTRIDCNLQETQIAGAEYY